MKSNLYRSTFIVFLALFVLFNVTPAFGKDRLPADEFPSQTNLPAQYLASERELPQGYGMPAEDLDTTPDMPELQCPASPFGNVLDLYDDQEIFLDAKASIGMANLPVRVDYASGNEDVTNLYSPLPSNVIEHVAEAADLDGDGKDEYIEWYSLPGQNVLRRFHELGASHGITHTFSVEHLAIASGNILGNNSETEQVVVAGRDNSNAKLWVQVWTGGGSYFWSSDLNNRENALDISVAVGNLNNNNFDDIVLAVQTSQGEGELIVLEFESTNLIERDYAGFSPTSMDSIEVATARLDGDLLDEIVLAFAAGGPSSGAQLSFNLDVDVYGMVNNQVVPKSSMGYSSFSGGNTQNSEFSLAIGDLNGDFLEEIIVTYDTSGGGNNNDENGLVIAVLQSVIPNPPSLPYLSLWTRLYAPNGPERGQPSDLATAAGDLNRDSRDEIVFALNDGTQLEVSAMSLTTTVTNTVYLTNTFETTNFPDVTGVQSTALALGDFDNDSIKGVFSPGDCKEIIERRVTAAVFTPPYWDNLQDPAFNRGTIGASTTEERSAATEYNYSRSHSLYGFVGAGVEGEYGIAKYDANVRALAEEEFTQNWSSGTSVYTSTKSTVYRWDENPFVTFDRSLYDCYSYVIQEDGAPLNNDVSLRNCEIIRSDKGAADLPTWETTWGPRSPFRGANEAMTWSPVVRDWTSLSLFRSAYVTQSSGDNGAKAVDGQLKGQPANMTATSQEDDPWWQVDLGEAGWLTKLRVWGLDDRSGCQDRVTCPAMLTDLVVFVSETPFTSDDPDVLKADPNVFHTTLADLSKSLEGAIDESLPSGRVTTFQLLDAGYYPVWGRYVRVQIDRPDAVLSMAEVQVFGLEHKDPHQYPVEVRDLKNDDGYFEVLLYDPYDDNPLVYQRFKWIEVRGNLLWEWEGAEDELVIGPGGVTVEWNLTEENGSSLRKAYAEGTNHTVGVEFDLTVGVGGGPLVGKVQVGGGYKFTTGVTEENAFTTSWSEAFIIGGYVEPFAGGYGQAWNEICTYSVLPYFYQITEESTFGVTSSFTVLDYTVPGELLNRGMDAMFLDSCTSGTPPTYTTILAIIRK